MRALGDEAPVPEGCVVEPAGRWNDREVEVVYDPRRYQVALVRDGVLDDLEGRLSAGGWEYQGTDGRVSLWVRDQVMAARAALGRLDTAPGRELGGPAL